MTDKQIIHGEQVPLITLTRQQLEEDWFTLWELYKAKEQECEDLKKQITILDDETIVVEITEKQFEEYQQLKKALTEIKNVIGDRNKEGEAFCDDRLYKIEQILQKCEVINE